MKFSSDRYLKMFNHFSLLDSAVILGILIQFTKIGDLIFREHQKKMIQSKFESLILKLEYSHPEKWFNIVFQNKKLRIILLILPGIILSIIIFLLQFIYTELSEIKVGTFRYWRICLLTNAVLLIPNLWGFKYYGMKIIKWLTKDKFSHFFLRYIVFMLALFAVLDLPLEYFLRSDNATPAMFYIYLIIFGLSGIAGVWFIITLYGYIVVLYRIIIFIIEILLKFFKGVIWRIVEYNKGAVAAVSLLITFVVGILDIWIKSQK